MIVHITPLHYWSQLDQEATAFAFAVGKALAFAMSGNAPYEEVCRELRAQLASLDARLDEAFNAGCSRQDGPMNYRKLVFTFLNDLAGVDRDAAIRTVGLEDPEDSGLPKMERYGRAFKRAVDRGKLDEFEREIVRRRDREIERRGGQ